jgi:ribosomal protein S18 acetylase RimI-like enzyme
MSLQIVQPITGEHYNHVRTLIRAFVTWHGQRHSGTSLTSDYYGNEAFEQELASLPDLYAVGRNRLLLALYEGQPAGCVALREIDAQSCEMKRMFVHETFQGKGIGRALAQAIVKQATEMGFSSMKLDTSYRQTEALRLYENLGFKRIPPYYTPPKRVQDWLVFMELKL